MDRLNSEDYFADLKKQKEEIKNIIDKENRKLVLKLPNFDNEIFKEITGIDVCKELEIDK